MDDLLLKLPSVSAFAERVLDDLSDGRSVIVISPDGNLRERVFGYVDATLRRRDWSIRQVDLAQLPSAGSPTTQLLLALGLVDAPSSHAPADLLTAERAPDLVHLRGIGELPPELQPAWLGFLAEYAGASQRASITSGSGSPVFTLVIPAQTLIQTPTTDVRMSVRWWWGSPSTVEMQLLCRHRGLAQSSSGTTRWQESVVASLALNDVELARHLCVDLPVGLEGLMGSLQEWAKERGWTNHGLLEARADEVDSHAQDGHVTGSVSPPSGLRALYAMGALCCTPESGIELHSAAAALLGRKDIVQHRVWRAQCQALLPAIDSARVSMCRYLTARYGDDWPLRWGGPADDRESLAVAADPSAAGWGHIESLVLHAPALRSERRWLPVLRQLRFARNDLAHSRPVSLGEFEQLMSAAGRLSARACEARS